MAKLAEELIKSLYRAGVRYIFGIPGGPSIPYIEAMRNNGIEFITVANEQSAGIMASVFGRITGIPGVCHATFGPGATNLSTGVGCALLDRAPLLAFTSEFKEEDRGRKIQMNIDHQALFRPITKWTTRLNKDNFHYTISKGINMATAEIPGPVHIGLPVNSDEDYIEPNYSYEYFQGQIHDPNLKELEEMGKILQGAKRPIIALGLTAFRHSLHSPIREFINKNNIPVVLTPMAKGIIPEEHPCYAGVLFHAKSDYVAEVYRRADLVIGIGYDSIEFNYEAWMPKVPLIHIDTEPADITPEYHVASEIIGRLDSSIKYLNSLELPRYEWNLKEIQQNKINMYEALKPRTEDFNPSDAIMVLQNIVPRNSIVTADVGAHLHLLGQLWKMKDSSLIMTNGWSTMGFGIPSAIGAKLCRPSSTVVCITGDGGFLMNCGELLVARRLGINIVVIVLVDGDYSLIKVKQDWKKVIHYGTTVNKDEYFQSDKFLGVPILKVQDRDEMKDALLKAFGAEGPVIIEALVDGSIYHDLISRYYK